MGREVASRMPEEAFLLAFVFIRIEAQSKELRAQWKSTLILTEYYADQYFVCRKHICSS